MRSVLHLSAAPGIPNVTQLRSRAIRRPQTMQKQQPKRVVALAGQQAVAGAGAGAWLQLSPDTMHQHRLHSQQLCLVGLVAPQAATTPTAAAAAAAAAASPSSHYPSPNRSSSKTPNPSKFAPAANPVLNLDNVILVDLQNRAGIPSSSSSSSSSSGDQQQQQQQQQQQGRFLVAVTLWPCARLERGSAVLSPAAWASLIQPEAGTYLAIFEQQHGDAAETARSVTLRLCINHQGLPLTDHDINTDQLHDNISTAAAAGSSSSSGGYTTPVRSRSNRPPSGSSSSSSRKAGSSSSKKGSGRNSSQQQQQSGSSSSKGDVAQQWQVRLLHEGIDWSKPKHRQLVQQLALRQLAGRTVLPGTLVYIPVLGLKLLFQLNPTPPPMLPAAAAAAATGPKQQQQQQQQQQCGELLMITGNSQIQLLMPGEDQSNVITTGSSSCSQQAAAAMAAVTGLGSANSTAAAAGGFDLASRIAAARAAAAECAAALLVVNGPDVISEYYGESEASLTGIFAAAAALSPSIIFIDEIDAIAPSRESQGHGGSSSHTAAAAAGSSSSAAGEAAARVLTQLLTLMDGLSSSSSSRGRLQGGGDCDQTDSDKTAAAAAAAAGDRVVVIGATNRPSVLDPALRRPGRFERELEVGVPDPAARADILAVKFCGVKHSLTSDQLRQLAATTHGFVGADLAALVNEAALMALRRFVKQQQQQQVLAGQQDHPSVLAVVSDHQQQGQELEHQQEQQQQEQEQQKEQQQEQEQQKEQQQEQGLAGGQDHVAGSAVASDHHQHQHHHQQQQQQQQQLCVTWSDVVAARVLVKPSALREVAVEVPQISWDDVGGLSTIKQRLQEAVLWPQQHADSLQRLGAVAPKGILLYGPPGCSKTLLAKAVAATAGLNFLSVKGGELYSKYVGESERAIVTLFARARGAAPAVIFFDEIDGLVSQRGDGGGGGMGDRVLAQLLTEMDGLQPRLGVVVLAATNRPDKVDPALLRPGRFDRLLLVPPPDAAGRLEILKVHTRKTPLDKDVDLEYVASRTDGYTGADISALCREAAMSALEEDLSISAVSARHFDLALLRVLPSSSPSSDTMAMFQQFQRHSGAVTA